MKWLFALIPILAIAAFFAYRAFAPAPEPERPASAPLTVQFTCDTNGRLEPCGCFTGQYGGLTRLRTFLKQAKPATNPIRLDVGGAIAGPADYQIIQYQYILQAYSEMGFHALNIGHREAELPAATLSKLAASSPAPMISANLLDATSNAPLLKPYRILPYNGIRVAIIGLLDPESVKGRLGDGLALQEMAPALSSVLPQIKDKADTIILLAFTTEERMRALAKEFYEIDIILGGNVAQSSQELASENRSTILFTTNQARTLGVLDGRAHTTTKPFDPRKFDIHLLHDRVPQAADILALSKSYREEIRSTKLDIDDPDRTGDDQVPGVRSPLHYVGSEACTACHQEDYQVWLKSGHAKAFHALSRRDSQSDPNCIGCHTIGFGTPSGYKREYGDKKLVHVGCESCHGPGSQHVKERLAGESVFKFRPLGAGDCTQCHHGEFSRPFEWDHWWPQIQHGSKKP